MEQASQPAAQAGADAQTASSAKPRLEGLPGNEAEPNPGRQPPLVDEKDPPAESPHSLQAGGQEDPRPEARTPAPPSVERYEFREEHDPNGIGKFYMGREIAHVMGFAAAPWLERPERELEEATSKMIEALALKPGMVVADVGAGSGVITLLLARQVGPEGRVLAVDVQQEMLDLLEAKLDRQKIANVELVLGTEKSPRLKEGSLDLALMVDVYHEFAYPYEMMLELSRAMKPGGKVVFVEFRLEDPTVPIKLVHKMSVAQVRKEIELPEFRLKWKKTHDMLPWQHIIVFERQASVEKQ